MGDAVGRMRGLQGSVSETAGEIDEAMRAEGIVGDRRRSLVKG